MTKVRIINRDVGAFVKNTRHLSVEDRGAYQEILDEIVLLGQDEDPPSLPDDDRAIANMLGWPIGKWKATKKRLCEGSLAVLVIEGGRLTQSRIVEEIEAAKGRIAGSSTAGKASAAKRQREKELRERMRNDRSTAVEPPYHGSINGSATDSPTDRQPVMSHESRLTKNRPDSNIVVENEPSDDDAKWIMGVAKALAPTMKGLFQGEVYAWLRKYPSAGWIGSVIAEKHSYLAGKNAGYLASTLAEKLEAGHAMSDADGRAYTEFRLQQATRTASAQSV